MNKPRTPWYRMDNASFMYSSIQREEFSAIYRFSAVMTEDVDPALLQSAVDRTLPRFPGFAMKICRGFFWYYFEPNTAPGPFVREDVADPCRPVRFNEDNGWLIRFYYYRRRISLEVFHALADGAGALTFFRNLLAEYLRQRGVDVPPGEGIADLDEPPPASEREDAYLRYAGPASRALPRIPRAYQNRGTPEPFYTFHVTMGFLSVSALREKARSYGASITEYLAAVLLKLLVEKQRRERPIRERPVALAVPVNLRAYFPTETLRNFILTVQPSVDPALGDYDFPQLAALVHNYMRLTAEPVKLRAGLTRGVRLLYNRFLILIPRVVKNPIMLLSYGLTGVRPYSAVFTNPGPFRVPESMRPYIEHMEVVQGQATVARPHVSSISYGDTMEITFSGVQKETDLEREFFRFLVREGLHVRIESNRQGVQ